MNPGIPTQPQGCISCDNRKYLNYLYAYEVIE